MQKLFSATEYDADDADDADDAATRQPGCMTDEKVELLKRITDLVSVHPSEVLA